MAIQRPPKQDITTRITGFTGVNLDLDTLLLNDTELQSGVNIDLHSEPGSILSRNGFEVIATLDGPVELIKEAAGNTIALTSNSVYEDFVSVGSINQSVFKSIVSFQGLNDSDAQTYIATSQEMKRISDGGLVNWGIVPPGVAPALAISSGSLASGTYSFGYSYVRRDGGVLSAESDVSPAASVTTISQNVGVEVIASSDPQVTHIRTYRTQKDGSVLLLDQEVSNTTQTVQAGFFDNALGGQAPEDNTPPTTGGLAIAHSNRVFVAIGNRLIYSQRFFPEYFPALNFIEIADPGEPIQALVSYGGTLGVFTNESKYRVVEQVEGVSAIGANLPFFGGTENTFIAVEAQSKRGTLAYRTVVETDVGVAYLARDGLYVTDMVTDTKISQRIQKIFLGNSTAHGTLDLANLSALNTAAAGFFKGRIYLSLPDITAVYSLDSQGWYFLEDVHTDFEFNANNGIFYAGLSDGQVYSLERPAANVTETLIAQTADRDGGARYLEKLFLYTAIDYEVSGSDTITAEFIVDGVIAHTYTLSSSRGRGTLRLPGGVTGKTWSMRFTSAFTGRVKIFGVQSTWKPRSET